MKNINLKILKGSRIGIIGRSGSGKSTLANIILGLLDPSSGSILVDNKFITDNKESWYSCVASVPQNIFITEQSISENIAFGKKKSQINMNEIKKAAKRSDLLDFINSREKKYDEKIGEKGHKISTGQRQRIAIARALYKIQN